MPRNSGESTDLEATSPRPHVLIVDDDEELCRLLSFRLEHHAFRVSTEQTARGGLEVLEREVIDAMIVDVRLEHENGLDLLVEVQNRSVDLPVLILTAHGNIETAVEAIRRGAYGFLAKPFDDHELLQKLQHAVERVRLKREVAGLRRMVGSRQSEDRLLGTSDAIAHVRGVIARVGPSDATVLLLGESGTGKEVAARSIHALSPRADRPFIAINCGALPSEILESELFGHKRGSFTGAVRDKEGLLRAADGGTLFLDEIGDAPLQVQVKLLRVLQEGCYFPVGSTEAVRGDVRIIAATHHDLQADVLAGRFREDLFYRLHVVPIAMPPLRERREDVPLLAELFLSRASAKHGVNTVHIAPDALHLLLEHSWPGNVRELANVVEGAGLLSIDGVLHPNHVRAVLPQWIEAAPPRTHGGSPSWPANEVTTLLGSGESFPPMREARDAFDRLYLIEALRRSSGNVSAAAKMAGRNRTDFHDLLRRHGIDATQFRE